MMHLLLAALLGAAPDYPVLMKSLNIPGISVVVVRNGTVVSQTAYGVKNVAGGAPVDVDTRFEIGSITKQFTAAAILQLQESGKLSIDDKLGKYVPQYLAGRQITLRQMLLQISGIPDYTDTKAFNDLIVERGGRLMPAKPGSFDAVLSMIRGHQLDFPPGTKWAYSNSNYFLLGRVVEIASGMPWQRYIEKNVFARAGMTESSFMEDESRISDMATGYSFDKHMHLVPAGSFLGWAGGAGAIVSTAGDLAKWDAALFAGKIITESDRRLMMSAGPYPAGRDEGYGFGWVLDTYDGQPRIWHNGGTLGFTAINQIYPASHEVVIVLANSTAGSADSLADATFDALHPDLAAAKAKAVAGEDAAVTQRLQAFWNQVVSGSVDRAQLTPGADKAFTPELLSSARSAFAPLGKPVSWIYRGKRGANGLTTYLYYVTFAAAPPLNVTITLDPAGKIAGFNATGG